MKIDPDLRRSTLRAAIALLETAHDLEHVFPHAVPLLDALGSSPLSSTGAPGLRRISCGPCRRAASASFTRRGSIGPGAYLQQRPSSHRAGHSRRRARGGRGFGVLRFGLEVARLGRNLLAMRWEEGWDTPISIWRERLGLSDLLLQSPFQEELTLLC